MIFFINNSDVPDDIAPYNTNMINCNYAKNIADINSTDVNL